MILRSGNTVIGLFQDKFDCNLLTFNPSDVRAIQAHLKQHGVTLIQEAQPGEGPAHIMLVDPDGNPILFDQHADNYVPSGEVKPQSE